MLAQGQAPGTPGRWLSLSPAPQHAALGADRPVEPRIKQGVKSVAEPGGCPGPANTWSASLTQRSCTQSHAGGRPAAKASGDSPVVTL